jgi:hypothetical protein
MKATKILIIGLIFLPFISSGQYDNGLLDHTFFNRLPSARAEAMGKAYCSVDGDLNTAFFNPAGIATIKGFEFNLNYAKPFYMWEEAIFSFSSIGYSINKYLILSAGRHYFSSNEPLLTFDTNDNMATFIPYNVNYNLTVASQPIKNLFLGININLYSWYFDHETKPYTLYFDFGAIKKFEFQNSPLFKHSVNIGTSITNFSFSRLNYNLFDKDYSDQLPVITRFGANYQLTIDKHWLSDSLKTFKILAQAEYQLLLNSEDHSGIRTGAEIVLFDILSIRGGYFNTKYKISQNNYNLVNDFTYGFGLQLPLNKLTKIPLLISYDYTSLPQITNPNPVFDVGNYTSNNFKINWIIK